MSEHFIKNIEIKNFKCFVDFKAEGFGRVNLIGGKNNVGKTAFMEACYLGKSNNTFELYQALLSIKSYRNIVNILAIPKTPQEYLFELIKNNDFLLKSNFGTVGIKTLDDKFQINTINNLNFEEKTFNELSNLIQANLGNKIQYAYSSGFISGSFILDGTLSFIIGQLKIENKYEELNNYMYQLFGIQNVDVINNIPYIKKNNKFQPLYEYGNGIKSFINIILPLLLVKKNNKIFIDEIENGIHYSKLDKLWEIILTIAKNKNVQVFATTHSKECIESLVVANMQNLKTYQPKEHILKNDEIKFIELGRDGDDKLSSIFYDFESLSDQVEQHQEIRGW